MWNGDCLSVKTTENGQDPVVWIIVTSLVVVCIGIVGIVWSKVRYQRMKTIEEMHKVSYSKSLLQQEQSDELRKRDREMEHLKEKAGEIEELQSEQKSLQKKVKDADKAIQIQDGKLSKQYETIDNHETARAREASIRDLDSDLRESELYRSISSGRHTDISRLTRSLNYSGVVNSLKRSSGMSTYSIHSKVFNSDSPSPITSPACSPTNSVAGSASVIGTRGSIRLPTV